MSNYGENNIVCSLLNKTIIEVDCYDINMVRTGRIKVDELDLEVDKDKALKICPQCKHCPF